MFNLLGKLDRTQRMLVKENNFWIDTPIYEDLSQSQLIFKGEIYNLNELKRELNNVRSENNIQRVLVEYLEKYGMEALLSKINGIFAMAYFDVKKHVLYLVRDHAGIFPLYYYRTSDGIMFSSEVKMFLNNGVAPVLSYEGVFSYLANQSAQEPYTLIDGIMALGPGEMIKYSDNMFEVKSYWNPADRIGNTVKYDDFDVAGEKLKDLLQSAISMRDNSIHKSGILLSGGIDSSAIVAITRLLNPESDIHSFTVTHENKRFDESIYAGLVAKKNSTIEHELHVTEELIGKGIFEALDIADQPSVDGVNSYFSSKLIKECGFDSVVSGLGGEFFVEDDATAFLGLKKKYDLLTKFPKGVATVLDKHTNNKKIRYAAMLMKSEDAFFAYLRLLSDGQIKKIVSGDLYHINKDRLDAWHKVAYNHLVMEAKTLPDIIAKKYFYESRTWHVSTLLKDVMQNSVKQGVMPSFPLMDYHLIEYLFHLPISSKADFKTSKVHLVNAAKGRIPSECIYRKKLGFVFPFGDYFKGVLWDEMENFFVGGGASEFFNIAYLKQVWKDFCEGTESWAVIWKLYVLNRWIKQYSIQL